MRNVTCGSHQPPHSICRHSPSSSPTSNWVSSSARGLLYTVRRISLRLLTCVNHSVTSTLLQPDSSSIASRQSRIPPSTRAPNNPHTGLPAFSTATTVPTILQRTNATTTSGPSLALPSYQHTTRPRSTSRMDPNWPVNGFANIGRRFSDQAVCTSEVQEDEQSEWERNCSSQ